MRTDFIDDLYSFFWMMLVGLVGLSLYVLVFEPIPQMWQGRRLPDLYWSIQYAIAFLALFSLVILLYRMDGLGSRLTFILPATGIVIGVFQWCINYCLMFPREVF